MRGSRRLAATRDLTSHELCRQWQDDHDESARDQLISLHLGLAYRLASRYNHGLEPIDDLRQVAALGLVNAINHFDPAREIAFTGYAVPTILGELRRHFRDHSWSLHVTRATKELALRLRQAIKTLEQTGSPVTVTALADVLEVSVEQVVEAWNAAENQYVLSYDIPIAAEDEAVPLTVADQIGHTDSGFQDVETDDVLSRATVGISKRDQTIWRLYHQADQTQTAIADHLGISQMQVSRILRSTRAQLQANLSDGPVPVVESA